MVVIKVVQAKREGGDQGDGAKREQGDTGKERGSTSLEKMICIMDDQTSCFVF
jgi:hypothetical protein